MEFRIGSGAGQLECRIDCSKTSGLARAQLSERNMDANYIIEPGDLGRSRLLRMSLQPRPLDQWECELRTELTRYGNMAIGQHGNWTSIRVFNGVLLVFP